MGSQARHPGESRNPKPVHNPQSKRWIPAFAGMTSRGFFRNDDRIFIFRYGTENHVPLSLKINMTCRGDPPVAPMRFSECLGLYYRIGLNDDRISIYGGGDPRHEHLICFPRIINMVVDNIHAHEPGYKLRNKPPCPPPSRSY